MNSATSFIILDFIYKYAERFLKIWILILIIIVLYKINKLLKNKLNL